MAYGDIAEALGGEDSAIVFHANGEISLFIPHKEGPEELEKVPDPVLACTEVFMAATEDGISSLAARFSERQKRAS